MYSSHIEFERRERNRELMRNAAQERLVNEALARQGHGIGRESASEGRRAWLLPRAAAAAALLLAFFGRPFWLNGN